MKITVNPKYAHLYDFIRDIPDEKYNYDVLFKDNRNIIKKVTVDGIELVIKRYKRPTIANCFIYTFFRTNKAKRSYKYGFRLNEMGVDTGESVACIEIPKNGFFHTSYYVYRYLPYTSLSDIVDYDEASKAEICSDFVKFTIRLHEMGIIHRDYNPSNIFFYRGEEGWKFALIDTNRIRFRRKTRNRDIIKQLRTFSMPIVTSAEIVEEYAVQRGWNAELLCGIVFIKRGFNPVNRIKKFAKKLIGR